MERLDPKATRRGWVVNAFTTWRRGTPREDPNDVWVTDWPLGGTAQKGNPAAIQIEGALIHDEARGLIYEATIERGSSGPYLTSLTILTTQPGQEITSEMLRSTPVKTIADVVSRWLIKQEAWRDDGKLLAAAGNAERRGERPDHADLARHVAAGRTYRDIADIYGVKDNTAAKWLTAARKAGAIPTTDTTERNER
jgi:hypothetical protein